MNEIGRPAGPLFRSYYLGGFEASTHLTHDGRRLDMIAATRHDRFARADYERLCSIGIRSARDGFRWHLIDHYGGFDPSSAVAMVRAARECGIQVVWDLCHYGWPDDLDVFDPAFVDRFARYAARAAELVATEDPEVPFYCPINEISYLAWAGGDMGYLNPFVSGRGLELKKQLVRSFIAGVEAIRSVDPRARFVAVEPRTHLAVPSPDGRRSEVHREWECETFDMIAGRRWPELGGSEAHLDIIGVNYYPGNQFLLDDTRITRFHPLHRPVHEIFAEVMQRYRRPTFLGETSAGGEQRPEWLGYVSREARAASCEGMEIQGICIYPVLDHPAWDDGKPLEVGMWSYADDSGDRVIHRPYREQLRVELATMGHRQLNGGLVPC